MAEIVRICASVHPTGDGKTFELMVGDKVIGQSKYSFDADAHMHVINAALESEFKRGYHAGRLDGIHDSE